MSSQDDDFHPELMEGVEEPLETDPDMNITINLLLNDIEEAENKLKMKKKVVEDLEKEKCELDYQIKHLIKRKELLEKQSLELDKMAGDDGSDFNSKAEALQAQFLGLIEDQKRKVLNMNNALSRVPGVDVAVETEDAGTRTPSEHSDPGDEMRSALKNKVINDTGNDDDECIGTPNKKARGRHRKR
ncbi:hypothetical protein HDE_06389 [Halotydeus destructor]|nr:hypothetical protein HDE_06389 [Halotydeus destructor]